MDFVACNKSLTDVKEHKQFAPLMKLLESIFCTTATSAPVERVFSQSGLFMRPHRARLGDKLLSELVFCKCNEHLAQTMKESTLFSI
jgi:hypothetical protein